MNPIAPFQSHPRPATAWRLITTAASSRPAAFINAVATLLLVLPLFSLPGCATAEVAPGADPVVVRAEQATQAALETFDVFLAAEHAGRDLYRRTFPEAHELAERIRRDAPDWLASARAMTRAYKAQRTAENKAGLATALAVMETGLREAQSYLAEMEKQKGRR